jgi:hypothetical protein
MLSFDHWMHVRMLKESSELARKYRIDCWLEKVKIIDPEKNIETAPKEEIKETWPKVAESLENVSFKEIKETVDFTKEDLISKLKEAKIPYHWNSKDETLLKLCIENNLI